MHNMELEIKKYYVKEFSDIVNTGTATIIRLRITKELLPAGRDKLGYFYTENHIKQFYDLQMLARLEGKTLSR